MDSRDRPKAPLPLTPVKLPDKDRFGLPHFTLLSDETEEQKSHRLSVVRSSVGEFFDAVAIHLGEEESRALFKKVVGRERGKHGKRRKGVSLDLDAILLEAYDVEAERGLANIASLPRQLSIRIDENEQGKFGPSPESIAKRLRRLLKLRERKAAEDSARHEEWRERYRAKFGEYPAPALLSEPIERDNK